MIKTGSAWAGSFVTLDATGAVTAATGTPTGTLYVDGTANGASVTITGSNPYKWSVTLPSLTAGQRVDMYITGTIATIATAGFVASEQADTSLTSEVKTDTAAILADTGTDGVVLKAAGLNADAVAEIQNGLATATALATAQADLDNPNQYKADVSGIPAAVWGYATRTLSSFGSLIADIWSHVTRTLSSFGFTVATNSDANVTAIKAKTDNLPADPADDSDIDAQLAAIKAETALIVEDTGTTIPATITTIDNEIAVIDGIVDAILDDTGTTGVLLSTSALTSIFDDETIVGTYTFSDLLKIMAAALAGKATGGGTTTVTFRGVDDTSDVIVATVDANGNRSAVTLTV
jgi:hypothetical protein